MPSPVIKCVELTKAYSKRIVALNNLTLTINEGASFGLLGENGAGKSTLVRLLMGFIFPTSGRVRVLGEEKVARAHPRIGYVHERPIFETRFKGRAYLTYLGELSGLWGYANQARVDELLERVNLYEAAARSQWEVRQIISALRKQGKTVLLCSHYLAEVEVLCDTVGILRRGELLLSGTVADLLHSQDVVEIALANNQPASDVVTRLGIDEQVIEARGNLLRIPGSAQTTILAVLVRANVPILSLNPLTETLEEVYVRTTRSAERAFFEPSASGSRRGGQA